MKCRECGSKNVDLYPFGVDSKDGKLCVCKDCDHRALKKSLRYAVICLVPWRVKKVWRTFKRLKKKHRVIAVILWVLSRKSSGQDKCPDCGKWLTENRTWGAGDGCVGWLKSCDYCGYFDED